MQFVQCFYDDSAKNRKTTSYCPLLSIVSFSMYQLHEEKARYTPFIYRSYFYYYAFPTSNW